MKLKIKEKAFNKTTTTEFFSLPYTEEITELIKDLLNEELKVIDGFEIIFEIGDWEENYQSVGFIHQVVIKSWTKKERRAFFKWYDAIDREVVDISNKDFVKEEIDNIYRKLGSDDLKPELEPYYRGKLDVYISWANTMKE